MGNIIRIFKAFYEHYDSNAIRRAYGTISQRTLFSELYQKVSFLVEIRMKKDVFAMQLNTDSIVSMELMTVIGFFFDKYSEARNCVWTKNPQKIKKFFSHGISEFIEFGGEITLNLTDDSIQQIVNMLQKNMVTSEIHTRLVENFKLLENKNWVEYEEYIENAVLKEENEKHVEEVTCMDLPLDWSNVFSSDERATDISAESPAYGLVLSLNNLGRVDIECIAQITGLSYKEVITALKGSIYQNPDSWNECFYIGWETADEYLSGRVVDKLKKAKRANEKYSGYFSENIDALKKVIPKSVSVEDIYVTLGSPWVPPDVIDNFIAYLFQDYEHCSDPKYKTFYDEVSGVWKIPKKNRYSGRFIAEKTYGTKRLNTLHIIEKTFNMKTVFVTDEVKSLTNKSGKKRKLNKTETMLALEKQKLLIEKFREWVWKEPARKEALHRIYDEKYCSSVIRHYDGSFLKFPQMSPDEELYDYQKNAVARIMFSANTLLAHDVGAGKTFEMIAAGMEMRRIGISKKNLYVVPNTLTGQWKEMFERLYPSSNVLCAEPNREIQEASNARGTLPLFAKRLLKDLRKPQTDWRTVLADFIQEEICDYSFSPPDRRFDGSPFFLPDFNETEISHSDILFMVDTSGSMSDDMITAAFSEIKGAIDQFDGKLKGWLGFFNAAIVEPIPFETVEEFEVIYPEGGGGTDFQIIFEYVHYHMQEKLPASIIILTDGYAPFPDVSVTDDIPVLWLLNNEEVNPPWGKIARIKV